MQWDYGFDFGADTVKCAFADDSALRVESAYAAFRISQELPFAWGDRAYPFWGRETPAVKVKTCFSGGRAMDVKLTAEWMCRVMSLGEKRVIRRRRALIAVSPFMSEAEEDLLLLECANAGMDVCGTVHADMAAALGAGIDIPNGDSAFILDIGASQIGWYVLAGGRRVQADSLPYGFDMADKDITNAVRLKHNLSIGPRAARIIKHSAFSSPNGKVNVAAFDPVARLPRYADIGTDIAAEGLNNTLCGILTLIKTNIARLPAGLAQDIQDKGITLVGGGSNLGGLDKLFEEELTLPAAAAQDCESCTAKGLKLFMDDPERCTCLLRDWHRAGAKR